MKNTSQCNQRKAMRSGPVSATKFFCKKDLTTIQENFNGFNR